MSSDLKRLENLTFGSWRLLSLVDSGGMGVIFHGQHVELGTRVAVKVLSAGMEASQAVVVRFLNEAKIGANIIHPNIARTIDLFRDETGRSFIVMEWLDGESLGRRLARGPCKLAEAMSIFLGACRGLGAAHAANVVHRDIKPGNVFLAVEHGAVVPKLIDFGIARFAASTSHTRTGMVMGSPPYMSPEQWKGAKLVTAQSDIFALGVVLYEMLAGYNPFNGETLPEVSHKITTQRLPPNDSVPPALYEVLLAATARDPAARITTVDVLAARAAAAVGLDAPASSGSAVGQQTQVLPPFGPRQEARAAVAPTYDATVAQAPARFEPSPAPPGSMLLGYAPVNLLDEHAIPTAQARPLQALQRYLVLAGPITVIAAVASAATNGGAAFADFTAERSAAALIGVALGITAVFAAASFSTTPAALDPGASRAKSNAAIVLLLLACWMALLTTGELWATLYTSLSDTPWRRDPIRREVLHFGLDTGAMWIFGLLVGAVVSAVYSGGGGEAREDKGA